MQPDDSGSSTPNSPHAQTAKKQKRGTHGQFVKGDTSSMPQAEVKPPSFVSKLTSGSGATDNTPPLLSFKITNPVTYLKLWWRKIMSNEGIDFRFRIHPITAVVITLIILGGTFSAGFIVSALRNVPVVSQFIPTPTPLPATPNPIRDTAFTGILRKVATNQYYLQTGDGQAVTLQVPTNVDLESLIGKRIFASGKYNTQTGILLVENATSLEVLIKSTSVPTSSPSPTPTPEPTISPAEVTQ